MLTRQLVVGAGPVGRHVASILLDRGDEVVIASRSGRDTGVVGARYIALDASDADALSRAAEGVATIFSTANPGRYPVWEAQWPPLAAAMLTTAEHTGAVYAMTGNLYPYGPVTVPMVEGMPNAATDRKGVLRARIWADALAAHRAGRVRAFEVRGSDYIASSAPEGHVSRVLPRALAGRGIRMIGGLDQPHTFTDVKDVARLLVAAADDPSAHGRTWHVPSHPAISQRQIMNELMDAAGRPRVRIRAIAPATVRALGMFSPLLREVSDLTYLLTRPYILDDSAARQHFGMTESDWDDTLRRTVEAAH
ncbi:NAD-dependent epimerase/dehydratase family protein [Streptomyces sp. NPDC056987]|uniref:NAD-dependent epimerase/dehydratase family protein n=1 Tax=Streptomyces sp. NPDC056987 TaxID=3345988 RepID=UPI0036397B1D